MSTIFGFSKLIQLDTELIQQIITNFFKCKYSNFSSHYNFNENVFDFNFETDAWLAASELPFGIPNSEYMTYQFVNGELLNASNYPKIKISIPLLFEFRYSNIISSKKTYLDIAFDIILTNKDGNYDTEVLTNEINIKTINIIDLFTEPVLYRLAYNALLYASNPNSSITSNFWFYNSYQPDDVNNPLPSVLGGQFFWAENNYPPEIINFCIETKTITVKIHTRILWNLSEEATSVLGEPITNQFFELSFSWKIENNKFCVQFGDVYWDLNKFDFVSQQDESIFKSILEYDGIIADSEMINNNIKNISLMISLTWNQFMSNELICNDFSNTMDNIIDTITNEIISEEPVRIYSIVNDDIVNGGLIDNLLWIGTGYGDINSIINKLQEDEYLGIGLRSDIVSSNLSTDLNNQKDVFNTSDDRKVDGAELTLKEIEGSLTYGGIHIKAKFYAEIECAPDADIDTSSDILITISSYDDYNFVLVNEDISVDWSCLDYFLSIVTIGIYAVIRTSITSSFNSAVVGSFNVTNDIIKDMICVYKGDNDSVLEINKKRIEITPDGMMIFCKAQIQSSCAQNADEGAEIESVHQDSHGNILIIRLKQSGWIYSTIDAANLIDKDLLKIKDVHVVHKEDKKFLRSNPNSILGDNLDNLSKF